MIIIIINLITYIKQHFQPVIRIYHFTILKYKKCRYYLCYIVNGTLVYLLAMFPLTSVWCVHVCVWVQVRAHKREHMHRL